MKPFKLLFVVVLLAGAFIGRSLLLPGVDDDLPPLPPIERVVADEPADVDWQPNPAVRDPFEPRILPVDTDLELRDPTQ